MYVITLVTNPDVNPLTDALARQWQHDVGGAGINWLHDKAACDIYGITDYKKAKDFITQACDLKPIDWCLQSEENRRKKLLISDMDSTIIGQECIDELADLAGIGEKVSAITEEAMQGKLDFSQSLTKRVALLEGLSVTALERVWQERIKLNDGARTLVQTMKKHGAYTMLVSGGFTFFTAKVAEETGFDAHHANVLIAHNDKLLGRVATPILDSKSKAVLLKEALSKQGLNASDAIAVGDGANDADMITASGLGVAYYAKPVLQNQADASINVTDLTSLLYFQGYKHSDFAL